MGERHLFLYIHGNRMDIIYMEMLNLLKMTG